MKELNTLPIEDFLDRVRIAVKTNQKSLNLTIKEAVDLQNSLSIVMTRLSGELDKLTQSKPAADVVKVKMDGGGF
jgi:hypothetical protein